MTVTPIFLRLPPYSFTTSQQGLTFVGPVIGSLLGGILCGKLNDIVIRALSKRNDGIFEPEMRLPVTCVPMVATIVGLLMFGIGIENGDHWIVPVIGSTLVSAGLSAIPSTLQPYLLDSYFAASLDVFTVGGFDYSELNMNSLSHSSFTEGKTSWFLRLHLELVPGFA